MCERQPAPWSRAQLQVATSMDDMAKVGGVAHAAAVICQAQQPELAAAKRHRRKRAWVSIGYCIVMLVSRPYCVAEVEGQGNVQNMCLTWHFLRNRRGLSQD